MIYIDIDGTLLKFYETLKEHFGIEIQPNDFATFHWRPAGYCGKCKCDPSFGEICIYPTPEEFYAKAEMQPWVMNLIEVIDFTTSDKTTFLTKDNLDIKIDCFSTRVKSIVYGWYSYAETPDKSIYCKNPIDLLIDDNAAECEAWRTKGGIAYHFDLAQDDPFGRFLKWWRLEK